MLSSALKLAEIGMTITMTLRADVGLLWRLHLRAREQRPRVELDGFLSQDGGRQTTSSTGQTRRTMSLAWMYVGPLTRARLQQGGPIHLMNLVLIVTRQSIRREKIDYCAARPPGCVPCALLEIAAAILDRCHAPRPAVSLGPTEVSIPVAEHPRYNGGSETVTPVGGLVPLKAGHPAPDRVEKEKQRSWAGYRSTTFP